VSLDSSCWFFNQEWSYKIEFTQLNTAIKRCQNLFFLTWLPSLWTKISGPPSDLELCFHVGRL